MEAAKETNLVYKLLLNVGIEIKLPLMVWVHKVRAISISENTSNSSQTKPIDIAYAMWLTDIMVEEFLNPLFWKQQRIWQTFLKSQSTNVYCQLVKTILLDKEFV